MQNGAINIDFSTSTLTEIAERGTTGRTWDSDCLLKAYRVSSAMYAEYLPRFIRAFRKLHREDRLDDKSWEIIIGWWLSAMFDLIAARQLEVGSILSERSEYKFEQSTWSAHLKTSHGLIELYNSVEFNQWLYYSVSKLLSSNILSTPNKDLVYPTKRLGQVYNTIADLTERGESILLGASIGIRTHLKIAAKTRILPKRIVARINSPLQFDQGIRSALVQNLEPANNFEESLFLILSRTAPLSYIENFRLFQSKALEFHPKKSSKIFSSVEVIYDDFYKFVSAYGRSIYNSTVVGQQHGGAYGTSRIHRSGEIESRCADIWLSWGFWGYDNSAIIKSDYLTRFVRKIKNSIGKDILIVLNDYPRHTYWLYDCPQGSGVADWFIFWGNLINALGKIESWKFRVRPYVRDSCGWNHGKYLENIVEKYQSIKIDNTRCMEKSLESAFLVVTSTNGTLWLEAMCANIPVIAVLPEKWWPLNPNFSCIFNQMRDLGLILFDSITLNDFLLKNNRDDILRWWNSNLIQVARREFLRTFANL
jgi:putative transferase (TIGR04331 family)